MRSEISWSSSIMSTRLIDFFCDSTISKSVSGLFRCRNQELLVLYDQGILLVYGVGTENPADGFRRSPGFVSGGDYAGAGRAGKDACAIGLLNCRSSGQVTFELRRRRVETAILNRPTAL